MRHDNQFFLARLEAPDDEIRAGVPQIPTDAESYSDQAIDAPDAKPVDQDLGEIGLVKHATSPRRRDRPRSRADRFESLRASLRRSSVQNSERRFGRRC